MRAFEKIIESINKPLLGGHIQINIENVQSLSTAKTEIEDMLNKANKLVKTEYISDNKQE